jgi:hypothetical protein
VIACGRPVGASRRHPIRQPEETPDVAEIVAELAPAWRNPSYPQRVHVRERAQWQAVLDNWESRIAAARADLARAGGDPGRARLFAQMLGARDQIADAVRRLPQEVGDLYHEDQHRFDEAVAALERLFARWSGTK